MMLPMRRILSVRRIAGTCAASSSASSSSSSSSTSSSSFNPNQTTGSSGGYQKVYNTNSVNAQERRKIRQRWENAFYGKLYYEAGMRETYRGTAEEEAEMDQTIRDSPPSSSSSSSSGFSRPPAEPHPLYDAVRQCWIYQPVLTTEPEVMQFPPPEGYVVSIRELEQYPLSAIQDYILDRLVKGERRVRFATDFGGMTMLVQSSAGEEMLNECEKLLAHFGLLNDALRLKIQEVRDIAVEMRVEYDLT